LRAESPELLEVLPDHPQVEQLATGFVFAEGPVWVETENPHLLFSDLRGNALCRWTEDGTITTVVKPFYLGSRGRNVGPNGLALDPEGRLVVCDSGNRRLLRLETDGSVVVIADRYQGSRLNSPNDLVYGADGTLYFTDPPYGLSREDRDPAKELGFNGVYRLSPGGSLEVVAQGQSRPNGIALSPDQQTLYVSNSDPAEKVLMAYEVLAEGGLGPGRILFDFGADRGTSLPDGIKVDQTARLYVAAANGVWILTPAGRLLGVIELDEPPSNLAWGGDGSSLYVTATASLYRIQMRTVGFRPTAKWTSAIHEDPTAGRRPRHLGD